MSFTLFSHLTRQKLKYCVAQVQCSLGKFAFSVNYQTIKNSFNNALARIVGHEKLLLDKLGLQLDKGVNIFIVCYRAASSGTKDFFQSVVLLGQPFAVDSANFITFPNDETTGIIRLLGNNGIGYATVSQAENQEMVRVVPLNEISPLDKTAIQDGKYPISRNVYLAIRKQNSPAIKEFVDLALSPQGQQIAQQSGFIPLK